MIGKDILQQGHNRLRGESSWIELNRESNSQTIFWLGHEPFHWRHKRLHGLRLGVQHACRGGSQTANQYPKKSTSQ